MRKLLVGLGVALLLGGGIAAYVWVAGPTKYTLDLRGRPLEAVVDLSYFEGVAPDMTKQEVTEILGKTAQVHLEKDGDEESERWEWGRPKGIINYYFERTPDGGQGSAEYLPNHLTAAELLRDSLPFEMRDDKTYLNKVKGETALLTVTLKGDAVVKVNYYWR